MNKATWKSKTFWVGVAQVIGGGALIISGSTDAGLLLVGLGLTAITGSDRASKILENLKGK